MTHKEAKKAYPSVFTAVHYDTKVSVEIDHSDLDLDKVMDAFQTLIIGMGYHDEAFKHWVLDRADEYRETDREDFKEKLNEWKFDDEDIEVPHSNEHWNADESDFFGVSDELTEKEEWLENRLSEDSFPHYVTNEEADEDFLSTLEQDEQRYEDSHMLTSFPIVDPFTSETKSNFNGATQFILDFVEMQGDATYTEMNNYYRKAFGSNSFSHILKSLIIPYKNRPTRRYLVKTGGGNYEVKVATPSNWIDLNS
jgi:hypothetical protein